MTAPRVYRQGPRMSAAGRRPRIRRIVDTFCDWRGAMVLLSCGHIRRERLRIEEGRTLCERCRETGRGGEVPALHDIRCNCAPCRT